MPGALRPPAVHPAPYDRRAHDDRCRPHVCTPLGASTIRQIHFIVNGALKRAVRWRWVATSPIRQAEPVGAENSVASCDLHVLVDEATEPVSSDRPDGCLGVWGSAARGRALMQRSVRSVRVVVLCIFAQHDVEVTWSGDEEMVEALAA
jgi:hypothetical protein